MPKLWKNYLQSLVLHTVTAVTLWFDDFLVICCINLGEALQCHQCTSYEHAKCADPFTYLDGEERKLKTNEFLKDCPTDREYTLCRKVYQNGKWLHFYEPCQIRSKLHFHAPFQVVSCAKNWHNCLLIFFKKLTRIGRIINFFQK